jgi:TetR/AcrR family transcriptional repressor of bet genes
VEKRYLDRAGRQDANKDLAAFVHAHLGLGDDADEEMVRCWIVIGAEALRQPDVARIYRTVSERQITLLESIVKGCLKSRGKSTRSSRSIALGIFSAIEGSFRLLDSAPSLIEPGFAEPTVMSMARGAIEAAAAK